MKRFQADECLDKINWALVPRGASQGDMPFPSPCLHSQVHDSPDKRLKCHVGKSDTAPKLELIAF